MKVKLINRIPFLKMKEDDFTDVGTRDFGQPSQEIVKICLV